MTRLPRPSCCFSSEMSGQGDRLRRDCGRYRRSHCPQGPLIGPAPSGPSLLGAANHLGPDCACGDFESGPVQYLILAAPPAGARTLAGVLPTVSGL